MWAYECLLLLLYWQHAWTSQIITKKPSDMFHRCEKEIGVGWQNWTNLQQQTANIVANEVYYWVTCLDMEVLDINSCKWTFTWASVLNPFLSPAAITLSTQLLPESPRLDKNVQQQHCIFSTHKKRTQGMMCK